MKWIRVIEVVRVETILGYPGQDISWVVKEIPQFGG